MVTEEGVKHDDEKPRVSLVPPLAIIGIAEVLTYGAVKYDEKYGECNWRRVKDPEQRYMDAALRHILQYNSGEKLDEESGFNHLKHALANLAFLVQLDEEKKEGTD